MDSWRYKSWKNGNRNHRWGVAEIQKRSPPTTGRHAAAVLSNKGVPQFWEMLHFLLQTFLSPWLQNIHPFQLHPHILTNWASLKSNFTLLHKICNHQIHSTSFAWLTVNKKSTCTIITNKNFWSSWQLPSSFLSSTSSISFPLSRHHAKLIWWTIMNHVCSHPSINDTVKWKVWHYLVLFFPRLIMSIMAFLAAARFLDIFH